MDIAEGDDPADPDPDPTENGSLEHWDVGVIFIQKNSSNL